MTYPLKSAYVQYILNKIITFEGIIFDLLIFLFYGISNGYFENGFSIHYFEIDFFSQNVKIKLPGLIQVT